MGLRDGHGWWEELGGWVRVARSCSNQTVAYPRLAVKNAVPRVTGNSAA
ncbi:hypothetical protein VT84_28235 [Gemmata sp. SH-PL17]|nr:hypothetical protein VT84_28235 [Gemmata sp. SH-PL17]